MKAAYPDNEEKLSFAKRVMQRKARDHARTPVQWTAESPNAGFCAPDTKPWMRVNDDYKTVNAAAQRSSVGVSNRMPASVSAANQPWPVISSSSCPSPQPA